MRRVLVLVLLIAASATWASEPRFIAVDVFIDSPAPIAAWQFEFQDRNAGMQVVGIENGESEVFGDAAYYDREAVAQGRADRIVVADFTLADSGELPQGRIRVATLHVMLNGTPKFDANLVVVASHGGTKIDAEIDFEISGGSEK